VINLKKIQTCVFPFFALRKRPSDVRMGKGRCIRINKYIYPLKKNKILFIWFLKKIKFYDLETNFFNTFYYEPKLFKIKNHFSIFLKIFKLKI